jgi:hypothetical protein
MNTEVKSSRNLWPVGVIAACALFVAGTAALIVMACSQKVDLVSKDYYEQELRFQGQIDRAERTKRVAGLASVAYDDARQCITISLPPGHGHGNVWGSVELYRPSAAGLDRTIKLDPDTSGVQRLDASALAPGLWKVRVSWTAEKENYYLEQKVVVGSKAS